MRLPQILLFAFATGFAQQPQNPSPMVEHTRAHTRLAEETPPGRREKLDVGTLYLPEGLAARPPLLLFFHGDAWIPEVAAAQNGVAAIGVQAGAGSASYTKLFEDPHRFLRLLREAQTKAGFPFGRVILAAWSAGCGALRQILQTPEAYERVDAVACFDGIHADYVDGKPGPLESSLAAENLQVWLQLGRDAVIGRKRFLVTHSEVFPGTYASTTETADYLLAQLGVSRHAVLEWGAMGMQQLSEASSGEFLLLGFAGDSAPDHVDHLHSLPVFLQLLR